MANPTALDPILASIMSPTTSRTTTTCSFPRKQLTQKTVPDSSKEDMQNPLASPTGNWQEKQDTDSYIQVVKETKKKNPNCSINKEKQLFVAWLNTSCNSIVGVGQKRSTFWERIHKFYNDLVVKINNEKKNVKAFKPLPV